MIVLQAMKTKEQVITAKELTGWLELEVNDSHVLHLKRSCEHYTTSAHVHKVTMNMCTRIIILGASMVSLHSVACKLLMVLL